MTLSLFPRVFQHIKRPVYAWLITIAVFSVVCGFAVPPAAATSLASRLNWEPLKIQAIDDQTLEKDRAAHWIAPDLILLAPSVLSDHSNLRLYLAKSTRSQMGIGHALADPTANRLHGLELFLQQQPAWVKKRYPHLQHFQAYRFTSRSKELHPRIYTAIKSILKQDLAVLSLEKNAKQNVVVRWSKLQTYGVIDALYTSEQQDADDLPYGTIVAGTNTLFRLWAPTALQVNVKLYDRARQPIKRIAMREDPANGAWVTEVPLNLHGQYYRYEITLYHYASEQFETLEVTDPYSLSLSVNSEYSQVVDLAHPNTMPDGWHNQAIPVLDRPEQHIIYEMHVRDFSLNHQLTPNESAGKYSAFGDKNSPSVKHLQRLRDAGLNTLHLLPVYDIATVNEAPENVITLNDTVARLCQLQPANALCTNQKAAKTNTLLQVLNSYDPNSKKAQQLISSIRYIDGYNWGYDPLHYTVPEGSYAMEPEGEARIKAFRAMVQTIHNMGFRLIMDVVYNHTFAAGLHRQSVLDKIVPLYYHRLHPVTGAIEQSTCCENTATEHRMMAKLMIDSLQVWAGHYKIDGFRFDLMGHQPKAIMLEARNKVRQIDPDTYFYGEGWNFGEVANNAQFEQAAQLPLAGSEIGTFSDRLRDAVRGGSSFVSGDDLRLGQGLGNGLITLPNELASQQPEAMSAEFALSIAQAKVGLAGNLVNMPLQFNGKPATGKTVPYGDGPTGYALDPADTINYVSKHDNQTLWDNNQYRIAFSASPQTRTDMQILSLAYPLLSQGIPFLHMGSELLRSKGFLRDSFDFNEWFNQVDFTKSHNNYQSGLPPAEKDQANWNIISRLKKANQGRDVVTREHIQQAETQFLALLKIRSGSPLFSLATGKEIIQRMQFHDLGENKGIIAFTLNDDAAFTKEQNLNNIDSSISGVLVVFNNSADTQSLTLASLNSPKPTWLTALTPGDLHPALQQTNMPKWQETLKDQLNARSTLRVPAFSVGVWVAQQQ